MLSKNTLKQINANPIEWAQSSKLEELHTVILEASRLYYNSETILLSDEVFDSLIDIYNNRSPIPYKNIGAALDSEIGKSKLPVHMGSMNKTKSLKELTSWLYNSIDFEGVIITPKIDGTSALLRLKKTVSKQIVANLYTRGNGDVGKNIDFMINKLFNVQRIKDFLNTSELDELIFRGELIVSKSNFENLSSTFKSSRSLVNGMTNKKLDTNNIDILEFLCFEVISPNLKTEKQFEFAKRLGLSVVEYKKESLESLDLNNLEDIEKSVPGKYLINWRNTYNYDIDGIIITKNNINYLPDNGNPEYSLAFKINRLSKQTTIKEIIWKVSKHGILKPTILFDKINLGSSVVEKSTGFNAGYIFKNKLGPGSIVGVVLSGEVIPYIESIIKSTTSQMPSIDYYWGETGVDIFVKENCDDLNKKKIVNFIKVIGIETISVGLITHLFKSGYTTLKSILTITYEELLKINRIEHKLALKIIENINKVVKNEISLSKLMDASICFGFGFGEKRCKQVVNLFPNFLESTPLIDSLLMIPGWSDKSAKKFLEGLPRFKLFLQENDYIKFSLVESSNPSASSSVFPYKIVCNTGKRDKDIISFLNKNGIEIKNNITGDVTLLICDNKNSGSSKLKTAKERSIKILDIDEFKLIYKINNNP